MSINIQTFSGKVQVNDNLKVGQGHLFVDTAQNQVGINTSTPVANLHVTGNTYVTSSSVWVSRSWVRVVAWRVRSSSNWVLMFVNSSSSCVFMFVSASTGGTQSFLTLSGTIIL